MVSRQPETYSNPLVVGGWERWISPPPCRSHSPTPEHCPANCTLPTRLSSLWLSSQNHSLTSSPIRVKPPPPIAPYPPSSPATARSRSDPRSTDNTNRCESAPAAP